MKQTNKKKTKTKTKTKQKQKQQTTTTKNKTNKQTKKVGDRAITPQHLSLPFLSTSYRDGFVK